MSWAICNYQDCLTQRLPCSTTAFFRLPPTEPRRTQWILNSGNERLRNLMPNQVRFFCEKHFRTEDICRQITRTKLHKDAIPVPYNDIIENYVTGDEQLEASKTDVEQITSTVNSSMQEEIALAQREASGAAQLLEAHELADEHLSIDVICDDYIDNCADNTDTDDETWENEVLACFSQRSSGAIEHESESNMTVSATPATPVSMVVVDNSTNAAAAPDTFNTTGLSQTVSSNTALESNEEELGASHKQSLQDESYDSDRHFSLSLVYHFQRLNARKKARAKIKILTYLTTLEMEDDAELE